MTSPNKEGTDPNVFAGDDAETKKRSTPGTSSPARRQHKRRMSMRNRRVSFAPDPELTMVHTFEKEDYVGLADGLTGPSSPCDDMDVTLPINNRPTKLVDDDDNDNDNDNDITAGVPSLTALVAEDESPEATLRNGEQRANEDGWDITAAVPGLGAILEEDERGDGAAHQQNQHYQFAPTQKTEGHADPETSPVTAIQNEQSNGHANSKWGFVPGGDDTLDLDLAVHGKLFMGDATYNRMYVADPTMTSHQVSRLPPFGNAIPKPTPDWGAPAFVPPFVPGPSPLPQGAKDQLANQQDIHPALYESPALTTSSLNTSISTRRVSMGSVQRPNDRLTKRRASLAGDALAASLLGGPAVEERAVVNGDGGHQAEDNEQEERDEVVPAEDEQHTDELLADDFSEELQIGSNPTTTQQEFNVGNEDMNVGVAYEGPAPLSPLPPLPPENDDTTAHLQQHPLTMGDSRAMFTDPKTAYSTVFGDKNATEVQLKDNTNIKDTPTPSHGPGHSLGPGGSRRRSDGYYQGPPPGSAIAARYPGSAVATGRLSQGFTPSNLPPITFQDFTKLIEVQFLDNLRRGASINYADLAPNPIPKGIVDAYTLLCITAPNVKELEVAISTLQSETARLRRSAADLELMLGQANPPIFRHVQTASMEQLDAFRANFGMLKKVCRAKALVLLKDVRCQMEASKARRLDNAAAFLASELARIKDAAGHADSVANTTHEFAQSVAITLREREAQRKEEAARRLRVAALLAGLADARAGNAARRERKRELEVRLERVKASRAELLARLSDVQARQCTVSQEVVKMEEEVARGEEAKKEAARQLKEIELLHTSRQQESYGDDEEPVGVEASRLKLLARFKTLDRLERCTGIKIISTYADNANGDSQGPAASCRLGILNTPYKVDVTLEAGDPLADGNADLTMRSVSMTVLLDTKRPQQDSKNTADVLFRASVGGKTAKNEQMIDGVNVRDVISTMLVAAVPSLQARERAAKELHGVRLACPNLCELKFPRLDCSTTASDNGFYQGALLTRGITLLFSDLKSGRRFRTTLVQSTLSTDTQTKCKCTAKDVKVWFCSDGEEAFKRRREVEAAVEGATGLRDACIALSRLADKS